MPGLRLSPPIVLHENGVRWRFDTVEHVIYWAWEKRARIWDSEGGSTRDVSLWIRRLTELMSTLPTDTELPDAEWAEIVAWLGENGTLHSPD